MPPAPPVSSVVLAVLAAAGGLGSLSSAGLWASQWKDLPGDAKGENHTEASEGLLGEDAHGNHMTKDQVEPSDEVELSDVVSTAGACQKGQQVDTGLQSLVVDRFEQLIGHPLPQGLRSKVVLTLGLALICDLLLVAAILVLCRRATLARSAAPSTSARVDVAVPSVQETCVSATAKTSVDMLGELQETCASATPKTRVDMLGELQETCASADAKTSVESMESMLGELPDFGFQHSSILAEIQAAGSGTISESTADFIGSATISEEVGGLSDDDFAPEAIDHLLAAKARVSQWETPNLAEPPMTPRGPPPEDWRSGSPCKSPRKRRV